MKKKNLSPKDIDNIRAWEQHKTKYIYLNGKKDIPFIQPVIEDHKRNYQIKRDTIYEDDKVFIIFPTKKYSIFHLLVFPKKRLFNAITLQPKDLDLLEYMYKIGRIISLIFFILPQSVVKMPLDQNKIKEILKKQEQFQSGNKDLLNKIFNNFKGFFHIYPYNTVNWLHLHIMFKHPGDHNPMNYPVEKIIKYLKENKNILNIL